MKTFFRYTLITFFTLIVCIFLLFEKKTPVFMEYYLGDWVRKQTSHIYHSIFEESKLYSKIEPDRFWGNNFLNLVDLLTFESSFLQTYDVLNNINKELNFTNTDIQRKVLQLREDPLFIEYLNHLDDSYQSFFKYELINKLNSISVLEDFAIYDPDLNLLHTSNETNQIKKKHVDTPLFDSNYFYIPILDIYKTKRGYLIGKLNLTQSLNLPVFGKVYKHYMGVIVDYNGNIINKSITDSTLEEDMFDAEEGALTFRGSFTGVYNNYRILSKVTPNYIIVLFYPFIGYLYYIFVFIGYLFLYFSLRWLYKHKSSIFSFIIKQITNIGNSNDTILKQVLEVNNKVAASVYESQNSLQTTINKLLPNIIKRSNHYLKDDTNYSTLSKKDNDWLEDSFFLRDIEAKEVHGSKQDYSKVLEAKQAEEIPQLNRNIKEPPNVDKPKHEIIVEDIENNIKQDQKIIDDEIKARNESFNETK